MDEDKLNFKPELLTLEELSVIAVASQLWELPNIKQEIKTALDKYASYSRKKVGTTYLEKTLLEIPKMVVQMSTNQHLPEVLKTKVNHKIWEIGKEIFDEMMYLTYDLELDVKYAENIHLTSIGLTDDGKAFKTDWMDFPFVEKSSQSVLTNNKNSEWFFKTFINPLHYLACFFAEEEVIINFKEDIIKEIKSLFPSWELGGDSDIALNIMRIVIVCFREHKSCIPYDWLEIRRITNPSTSQMLGICTSCCFHKAFVYFWNHMNLTEQINYLEDVSKMYLTPFYKFKSGRKHLFRIVLFLIDKMNPSQKDNFILENFNLIFFMLLRKKHFQKFCLPLLNKYLSRDFGNTYWKSQDLLLHFVRDLKHTMEIFNDCQFHIQVLTLLLERLQKTHKQDFFLSFRNSIVDDVFNIFCIPVLKLIINDKDLQDRRDDMIKRGRGKFKHLMEEDGFRILNDFMDQVLISDDERNKFKQDFNFLEEWIASSRFDVVDRVLDWMHGDHSHAYKTQWYPLCCRLVPNSNASIDKFIKWYFGTQDEPLINNSKDVESSKEFCRELIYNVWFCKSLKMIDKTSTVKSLTNVLISVFGSEKGMDFKKNELVKDDSCVRFFCKNVVKYSIPPRSDAEFSVVDEFFDFCFMPTEKIDDIKKSIADNIDDWIEEFGNSISRLDIVVPLLDWIYGNIPNNCEKLRKHFKNHTYVASYYNNRQIPKETKFNYPYALRSQSNITSATAGLFSNEFTFPDGGRPALFSSNFFSQSDKPAEK